MCGIIGYTGKENAVSKLLHGLKALEYRGYDSAGVTLQTAKGIETIKTQGRISVLEEKINSMGEFDATCGIGHTRWATHGAPSVENAHPHLSGDSRFAVVHNGIIENADELREKLIEEKENNITKRNEELNKKEKDLENAKQREIDALGKIAKMTVEEAKEQMMKNLKEQEEILYANLTEKDLAWAKMDFENANKKEYKPNLSSAGTKMAM